MKTLLRQSGPIQSAVYGCKVLYPLDHMVRLYLIPSISFSFTCAFAFMCAERSGERCDETCVVCQAPTLVGESTVVSGVEACSNGNPVGFLSVAYRLPPFD